MVSSSPAYHGHWKHYHSFKIIHLHLSVPVFGSCVAFFHHHCHVFTICLKFNRQLYYVMQLYDRVGFNEGIFVLHVSIVLLPKLHKNGCAPNVTTKKIKTKSLKKWNLGFNTNELQCLSPHMKGVCNQSHNGHFVGMLSFFFCHTKFLIWCVYDCIYHASTVQEINKREVTVWATT